MRIISGYFKGRVISMPKGIRPTSDKVREALFEIIKGRIVGADFLDLYCGSGSVGIEAFSRGAKSVTFVDNDSRCISALKKNLRTLGILGLYSIDIYKRDVLKGLKLKNPFDVIFIDPPYYKDIARNTLIGILDYDILTRNAVIIVESSKKDVLPSEVGFLMRRRTCVYGDTKLEFFNRTIF